MPERKARHTRADGASNKLLGGSLHSPRRGNQEVDDFIHFMRTRPRETFGMRLSKHIPLPDIGHGNVTYVPRLGQLEGLAEDDEDEIDDSDDDEGDANNDSCQQNQPVLDKVAPRSSSLETEATDTDHAYESDLEHDFDSLRSRSLVRSPLPTYIRPIDSMIPDPALPGVTCVRRATHIKDSRPSQTIRQSQSLKAIPEYDKHQLQTKLGKPKGLRLPPILQGTTSQKEPSDRSGLRSRGNTRPTSVRTEVTRPSAPSPCLTPPLPGLKRIFPSKNKDKNSPVDYIDNR